MSRTKSVSNLNKLKVNNPNLLDVGKYLLQVEDKRGQGPEGSVISQKARIPHDKVEKAIVFWKPHYFSVLVDNKRLLNGIEAYELGDDKLHNPPNKVPYIAMCNLMLLEGVLRMKESWPTVEVPEQMVFGSRNEQEIADFWKNAFAPTLFQTEWAWTGIMALLAGDPVTTREVLDRYQEQLP